MTTCEMEEIPHTDKSMSLTDTSPSDTIMHNVAFNNQEQIRKVNTCGSYVEDSLSKVFSENLSTDCSFHCGNNTKKSKIIKHTWYFIAPYRQVSYLSVSFSKIFSFVINFSNLFHDFIDIWTTVIDMNMIN